MSWFGFFKNKKKAEIRKKINYELKNGNELLRKDLNIQVTVRALQEVKRNKYESSI